MTTKAKELGTEMDKISKLELFEDDIELELPDIEMDDKLLDEDFLRDDI